MGGLREAHADDALDVSRLDARDHRDPSVRRLLLEGRDPRGDVRGRPSASLYGVGLLTAGMTAFYMFRTVFLTFYGNFRGTAEQEHHLHESPASMTIPLIVLGVGAILARLRRHSRGVPLTTRIS